MTGWPRCCPRFSVSSRAGGRDRTWPLAAFGLLAALAATLVLRDSVAAVCVVWPSAAVVCLAAALAGRRRP